MTWKLPEVSAASEFRLLPTFEPMELEPPASLISDDPPLAFADEALARRAKAMACTVPLHELESKKSRVNGGAFTTYTVWELAFVAIDTVTVQMDFDRGAVHEAVIDAVVPYAREQMPERASAEHEAVAKWVLDELIGTTSQREFSIEYGDWRDQYVRRTFGFQLLAEKQAPDGSVYLRATDAAINVLVGALDTDVESAQAAAEAKLENLVRRGRLSDARDAAQQARYRTIQLGEQLRQDIAAVKRNLANVDWAGQVSPRIDGALEHIRERLEVERRIVDNIRETRDRAEDAEPRAQAATLITLLDDCQNRHVVLQRKLMEARQVFLDEQQRQVFAPPVSVRLRDLTDELLLPLLRLPLQNAEPRVVRFFERVLGPRPVRLGRLSTLVQALLAPPRERDDLGVEVIAPDLCGLEPFDAFPENVRAAAATVLDGVGSELQRLSTLLVEALQDSAATAHLVALHALHAFSPAIESHLRVGDERAVLVAWSDGTELPTVHNRNGATFGTARDPHRAPSDAVCFYGDDLLVSRLDLAAAAHLAKETA
jgi:hypothetical protein